MCTGPHAYIPVINTAKAELFFEADAQRMENVFNVLNVEAWTPTTLMGLATFLQSWATTYYKACWNPGTELVSIKCTDLSSESAPVVELPIDPPIAGAAQGGEPLPLNVTVVIKWLTSQRGRSFRGRTYVPGLDSSVVTANTIDAALQTAIASAASALWSGVREDGYNLAVVSYCNGKAWRTTGVATPITTWVVDRTIDSQRRRLPGRGR